MPRVLITGATSGLGEQLAKSYVQKKYQVLAIGRQSQHLLLLQNLGCEQMALDLSTPEAIEHLRQLVLNWKPDLIIHAAGFTQYGLTCDRPWQDIIGEHRVHCEALLALAHAQGELSRDNPQARYCLLAVSSALAYTLAPGMSIYSCAKQWMLSCCQLLDLELAPRLRVLCATPGPFKSRFHQRASQGRFEDLSWGVLSSEKVAARIIYQIEACIGEMPIGPKAWLAKLAASVLPQKLVRYFLLKQLKNRF